MKPLTCALVVISILVCCNGCWSRLEVENLAIVTAIALDRAKDGQFRVAVEIVRPSVITGANATGGGEGGGGQRKPVIHIGSTGQTPYDAWRNLNMQVGREMFFAHTQVIVVGEKLAREGIAPALDFAERRFRLRRNVGLTIVPGEAKEVLTSTPLLETTMGVEFSSLGERQIRQSKGFVTRLSDFFEAILSDTAQPALSKLNVLILDQTTGHKHVKLAGAAAFKEDKLLGWLNETQTRGLNRIKNTMGRGTVVTRLENPKGCSVSVVTERSSTKVKAKVIKGKPLIEISVKEEGEVADQECPVDMLALDNISKLNGLYSEAIKKEVEAAVYAAQKKYKVDFLGFGETFRRQQNKFYKEAKLEWEELFPNLPVEVKVEGKVRRVGLVAKPVIP